MRFARVKPRRMMTKDVSATAASWVVEYQVSRSKVRCQCELTVLVVEDKRKKVVLMIFQLKFLGRTLKGN